MMEDTLGKYIMEVSVIKLVIHISMEQENINKFTRAGWSIGY